MKTFEEYQAVAIKTPLSLRNNRDRVDFPIMGLQENVGKVASALGKAFETGKFAPAPEQRKEVEDHLSEILWCVAVLGNEAGISLEELANRSAAQLKDRASQRDSNQR